MSPNPIVGAGSARFWVGGPNPYAQIEDWFHAHVKMSPNPIVGAGSARFWVGGPNPYAQIEDWFHAHVKMSPNPIVGARSPRPYKKDFLMKSKKSNPPRRRAMRLRGYDYSQPGAYFVTICAQHRKCLFGTIADGKMQLNEMGKIVVECWNRISPHFPSVELDEYVVMPNHTHGIIRLGVPEMKSPHAPEHVATRRGEVPSPIRTNNRRGEVSSPVLNNDARKDEVSSPIRTNNRRGEVSSPTLGKIIAYFKYQSTKRINQHRDMPGTQVWQRDYYDHVVRDDPDLQRLRQYIQNNPMKWELDQLHPDNPSRW